MKYTFTCEEEHSYSDCSHWKNSTEFHADSLDEVLQNFSYFLKGCTFHIDGEIDVVKDRMVSTENVYKSVSSMDFIVESLSSWNEDANKNAADFNKCGICGLSLEIMSRHLCYQPECPIVRNVKSS